MKLHEKIWTEIAELIYDCNIRNYTIFYRNDTLYAYYEYVGTDLVSDMQKMAENEKNQEWWALCKPLQVPFGNRNENEWWASTQEVWHQD